MKDTAIVPPSHRPTVIVKRRLAALLLVMCVLTTATLLARAQSATSVRIVNNSTRVIQNLFLSPVGVEAWGADLLENSVIGANQTHTLSGMACDGDEIRVIAEDHNGCFMTQVVACGSESEWVVTNDTFADCGH